MTPSAEPSFARTAEHDMGAFQIDGRRIFFKIDYYDLTRSMHAEDPTNPATTERVLTIMLAEEY